MKLSFTDFEVELFTFGNFRLDGGAMFGNVPKNLWSKKIAADQENCIALTTRSILISSDRQKILVDVGLGDKWSDKQKEIYAIENIPTEQLPFKAEEITDVILTHLHFDHAGGISKYVGSELQATYPNAEIHLQKANYDNALKPNTREKASYLAENTDVLKKQKLNLLSGATKLFSHVAVDVVNGHTVGLQWIKVFDQNKAIVFPSDLIPTSHHTPLPYIMGYDICALTVLNEKEHFLKNAVQNDWLVVFEHDRHVPLAKIEFNEKTGYRAVT